MISWTTFKAAAIEYSRLRPHLVHDAAWVPTFGTKLQSFPDADTIGVEYIDYGEWASFAEVVRAAEGITLWDDTNGRLALTPAPTEAVSPTIEVVWKKLHAPTEPVAPATEGTFPTIPRDHIRFIEDLERAAALEEEADEIEKGPVRYTIGQTEVDRKGASDGLRKQAATLRARVQGALGEPLALWRS